MRAIVLVLCLAAAGGIAAYTHYWGDPDETRAEADAPVYTVTMPLSEPAPPVPVRAKPRAPEPEAPAPQTPAPATEPQPQPQTRRIAPDDRVALARALQRELKRVGCYRGRISGRWNAPSRAAMQAFVDRVNATLPTGDPDPVLLSLVQGHTERVCGADCPEGQTAAANGACLPDAVVAKAAKEPQARGDREGRTPDGDWNAAVSRNDPVPPEGMARRKRRPRRAAQEPQPPEVVRDLLNLLGLD